MNNFPFRLILGKAQKRSGNFKNSKGIQNSLAKDASLGKNFSEYTPKRKSWFLIEKDGSNKESLTTQRSSCSKSISKQSFSCQ